MPLPITRDATSVFLHGRSYLPYVNGRWVIRRVDRGRWHDGTPPFFGIVSNAALLDGGRDSKHRDCPSTPNVSYLESGVSNRRSPAAATRVVCASSLSTKTRQMSSQLEGSTCPWTIATVISIEQATSTSFPTWGLSDVCLRSPSPHLPRTQTHRNKMLPQRSHRF